MLGDTTYIEVETARNEIAFSPLPPPRLRGLAAIKRILGLFDISYAPVDYLFDKIVGPAIGALNAVRLRERPTISVTDFGSIDAAPLYSIIVPLHRRIDLMEYQLALFSRQDYTDHEFIYALDDPDQVQATLRLAESAYERFRMPFRLITLDRNVGTLRSIILG